MTPKVGLLVHFWVMFDDQDRPIVRRAWHRKTRVLKGSRVAVGGEGVGSLATSLNNDSVIKSVVLLRF